MTTGRASGDAGKRYPKSPLYELDEDAQEMVRQLLQLTPADDLEEALIPFELDEISLVSDGPPLTQRQWYLIQRFHAHEPAVIERLKPRMPKQKPDKLGPDRPD